MISDWDHVCPADIQHPVMRSAKYDAYACLVCNTWLSGKCGDPDCDHCKDRPNEPRNLGGAGCAAPHGQTP